LHVAAAENARPTLLEQGLRPLITPACIYRNDGLTIEDGRILSREIEAPQHCLEAGWIRPRCIFAAILSAVKLPQLPKPLAAAGPVYRRSGVAKCRMDLTVREVMLA
jgi:hypothetical protein